MIGGIKFSFSCNQVLECMYVRQATDLLDGLIPGGEEGKDLTVAILEKIIVFAIMWSLGALS